MNMFSGREPWFCPFTESIKPVLSRRLGKPLYSSSIIRRVRAAEYFFISSRINLVNQVHNAGKINPRYRFLKAKEQADTQTLLV